MTSRPKDPSPKLRTISACGRRNGTMQTDVDERGFDFVIDEPEKLGGGDTAPTPMEYVTGALGGCFNVTIELIAQEFGLSPEDIEVSCEGIVDHRGLFGTAEVSPHFQNVKVDISLILEMPDDLRDQFKRTCLKRCPVYNLIKDSGVPVQVGWHFNASHNA